jgi:SHS2 domain-containing protein
MREMRNEDRRGMGMMQLGTRSSSDEYVQGQAPLGVRYETFEHEADIGIRGFGSTMEEAFSNAAAAMFSVMVRIDTVKPDKEMLVAVDAPDYELLLIEWLNALLSLSDIERMVFSKFEVKIDGTSLKGKAWGDQLDRVKHEPKVEIKGATYHMLNVSKEKDTFVAQCVVDV